MIALLIGTEEDTLLHIHYNLFLVFIILTLYQHVMCLMYFLFVHIYDQDLEMLPKWKLLACNNLVYYVQGCYKLENTMDLQRFPACNNLTIIKVISSGYMASVFMIPYQGIVICQSHSLMILLTYL